jgi:hypothetical protein
VAHYWHSRVCTDFSRRLPAIGRGWICVRINDSKVYQNTSKVHLLEHIKTLPSSIILLISKKLKLEVITCTCDKSSCYNITYMCANARVTQVTPLLLVVPPLIKLSS